MALDARLSHAICPVNIYSQSLSFSFLFFSSCLLESVYFEIARVLGVLFLTLLCTTKILYGTFTVQPRQEIQLSQVNFILSCIPQYRSNMSAEHVAALRAKSRVT